MTMKPSPAIVGDYRKRGEKSGTRGTSGKRTDERTDGKSGSVRPTYTEIVGKVVKFKEGVRNLK